MKVLTSLTFLSSRALLAVGAIALLPFADCWAIDRGTIGFDPISASDFHSFSDAQAQLGQKLFYDPILSGNRNISCGTCHHHDHGSADGLSLGIGEGGVGLGPKRTTGTGESRIVKRIPRNAPALWNLGHKDIDVLFHDGRLEIDDIYGNGYNSPAEEWLPKGLKTVLAAQAVFPMTSQFEMAGNPRENEVSRAIHDRIDDAWPILAKRVRIIPEYGKAFVEAFDHIKSSDQVTIVEIANALAAFMSRDFMAIDSPFDQWLKNGTALNDAAMRGKDLFFGKANCASCHSGPLFTDQGFHAIGLPPFGPGRTRRFDPMVRDVGRMGESDRLADAYRFRTPSLRNVTETGPYGHNGAYPTLEGIIRHHANPKEGLANWTREMANLPDAPWLEAIDFVVYTDAREMARIRAAIDIEPVALSDGEITDLVAFLKALTSEPSHPKRLGRPETVPSGLKVD